MIFDYIGDSHSIYEGTTETEYQFSVRLWYKRSFRSTLVLRKDLLYHSHTENWYEVEILGGRCYYSWYYHLGEEAYD